MSCPAFTFRAFITDQVVEIRDVGVYEGRVWAISHDEHDPVKAALLRALKHYRAGQSHGECPICREGDLCDYRTK